jgi:hypothetical protein
MLGVFADDANHAAAVNDLALITDLLDGRADFHKTPKMRRRFMPLSFNSPTSAALIQYFSQKMKLPTDLRLEKYQPIPTTGPPTSRKNYL